MSTRYEAQDALAAQIRARWNSPLEDGSETTAVSFVMSGTTQEQVQAARIAHLFTLATGVPCLPHVGEVPGRSGIVSVASVNPERYICAGECLTMADEGLQQIDRAEGLADAEAGL